MAVLFILSLIVNILLIRYLLHLRGGNQMNVDLVLQENRLLRAKKKRAPKTNFRQRLMISLLSFLCSQWRQLTIFEPYTILKWRRQLFRDFWAQISRPKKGRPGRKPIPLSTAKLIYRLYRENVNWGAPRIHSEILYLGHEISEATVSRYLKKFFPDYRLRFLRSRQSWFTFLRNNSVAAMDFFTVYTATRFKIFYVLVFLAHGSRRILHWNVTSHPSSEWIKQQLREAFPYETEFTHLVHDNDGKFGAEVDGLISTMNIRSLRTSFRSPWQNCYVERLVGTFRRDCTDHILFHNEKQIRRVLSEYSDYYNLFRPHLGLNKQTPQGRAVSVLPISSKNLKSKPILGGLHHVYSW